MASHVPARSLRALARPVASAARPAACAFSTSAAARQNAAEQTPAVRAANAQVADKPRWSFTPPLMKAPFNPRVKDPRKAFQANEDPAVVERAWSKIAGEDRKGVDEEVLWLAVTHKSFDQGRRGFNDRLAFLGKRILVLQTTLALLNSSAPPPPSTDPYAAQREPISHPSLSGLPNLSAMNISDILSKERLASLARGYDLERATRWKPRDPNRLKASGVDTVLATSLYAVIGALALQKGGEVANRVAREKVLKPLGVL